MTSISRSASERAWPSCKSHRLVVVGAADSVVYRGRSGGGKSSVQSLLLRYYDPVRGKVTFDGQGR
jgi:ABC-type transport system involved in Fe-S cluster assembly fused permease/ATPase subunit